MASAAPAKVNDVYPRGLGECEACRGPLCVRNGRVECDPCGRPHPEHPLDRDMAALEAREKALADASRGKPNPGLPAADFAATVPDRVAALERLVAALQTRIAMLEQAVPRRKAG